MSVENTTVIAQTTPAVVALLVSYFKDIIAGSAKHIGSEITEKALVKSQPVYDLVKAKLHGTLAGTEALVDLEKAPEDKDTQASVRLQLKKVLEREPELLAQLQKMLQEAGCFEGAGGFTVNNNASVTNQANVRTMHGGALFGKKE